MRFIKQSDKIWTLEGFLSLEACATLIKRSEDTGYQEATVSLPEGAQMMKGLRDNYRVTFEDSSLAHDLYSILKPYLPRIDGSLQPERLYEKFRFYRYDDNQRFKRHIDGRVQAHGLESRLTFMVYLNADFEGGETKFNDITILPKAGMALLFIHEQKHESLPIERGTKYVLRSDIFYKEGGDI
ncbi:MAG: 2OG-Fe(II) oxygenase [Litorimonas sp.]